ncbi:MAG: carbohydrate-binding family V/XII [Gemmatimonadota bacterium]|nr:MAG: carbohydrate-binding family V/XII [Gemmatimonadota bacterium]
MGSNTRVPYSRMTMGLVVAGLLFLGPPPQDDEPLGWPREIDTMNHTVVLFQPQVESFQGNDLKARTAFSVTKKEEGAAPVFGVVWMTARVETDRDSRTVEVLDVTVDNVRFPDITEDQEQLLRNLLEYELPTWDMSISLDRLLTALELVERQQEVAQGLNMEPPVILFSQVPAILVTIDGEPILHDVEGSSLKRVINTAFTIVSDSASGSYFLFAGDSLWYRAGSLGGDWELAEDVPAEVDRLTPPPEEETEVGDEPEEEDVEPGPPPEIIVAQEPTELIVTRGAPEYAPITNTDLLYVTNSESDIVMELATQRHFVILSGRWFASPSLEGPWEHTRPDELPETFADIPPESEMGHLLVSVPGTEAAKEAVMDNQIPQTAAISRSEATLEVVYDGDPEFEPIEGTDLEYAVNTSYQVIKYGDEYFACHEAVWFVANSPYGPWEVADYIPADVSLIPPESPVYNVKYVYIYDSTPEVVYVGYTPGYTYTYVYGGTIVYGTGWWYSPWYRVYYYPRAATWGWHVRWNPWYGWGFGFSYSTGPFTFHVGYGGWYRGGWWGPVGYRGYRYGYHRGWHAGYRAGARAGYRAGYRAGTASSRYNNIYNRPQNRTRNVASAQNRARTQPNRATTRPNNVYSDRNGNVFRQNQQGNWQQRSQGNWQNNRSGNVQNLDRSAQARNRGAARTNNFQRSGGAARAGGRRR